MAVGFGIPWGIIHDQERHAYEACLRRIRTKLKKLGRNEQMVSEAGFHILCDIVKDITDALDDKKEFLDSLKKEEKL